MLIDVLPYAPKNVTQYGFAAERRRLLHRQDRADDLLVDDRRPGLQQGEVDGRRQDRRRGRCRPAPGQKPRAIQGGWGIGIPKNVDPAKKAAAWRALTWITNKKINNYEIEKYQIDANRTSAFQDPELLKEFPYLPDRAGGDRQTPTRSRPR